MRKMTRSRTSSGDLTTYYSEDINNANAYLTLSVNTIKQEIDKPITAPRFRFFWLNPDETIKNIIPEQDIILGGSYSENYQNGQRRSVSLTLFNESGKYTPSINGLWTGVKISFEMGLELESGRVIWFPKGIYNITNVSVSNNVGNKTVNIELSDKFSFLEGSQGTLETSYTIEPGRLIQDIIQDILNMPMGNGNKLDPKAFIYDSYFKGQVTQATITKSAGETYGAIILELADMLSAEVFYDTEGHLNFVSINDATNDAEKPVLYNLYDFKGDFANNDLSFDFTSVINRVIVIGANVNGNTVQAIAINDDPGSPLCYQRIGYRTASPINDSNITTEILAQERANYELRKKLILKSSVSNTIRYNPLLLVNNLVSVTDDYYTFRQERFLVQSISCPLDYSGTMSISSSNVRNLPFTVA